MLNSDEVISPTECSTLLETIIEQQLAAPAEDLVPTSPLLFFIDVALGDHSEKLEFYEGDDPMSVAIKFCAKHGLDTSTYADTLNNALLDVIREKAEEEKAEMKNEEL